jgi:SAM-dependent methyltransferase
VTRDRLLLRTTFDEVPELYDRVRPRYPDAVFDDLAELARLPTGGRILEIGPGTGQATRSLAERGYRVVAVELGPRLAALARRNLARFDSVEVVHADFETWEPDAAEFDGILSFTAFHWLDPEERYSKCARLLRPNGALGVVETAAVLPDGFDPFWVEVQEDYDAVVPSPDNRPPPRPDETRDLVDEIAASGVFGPTVVSRHIWVVEYTADEWIGVMDTFSPVRALDPDTRAELLARIHRRIEARPAGRMRKHYQATLNVARRLP